MCLHHLLFIHSSLGGLLPPLTIVSNAAMNMPSPFHLLYDLQTSTGDCFSCSSSKRSRPSGSGTVSDLFHTHCGCSSFLLLSNVAFLLHKEDFNLGREGVGLGLGAGSTGPVNAGDVVGLTRYSISEAWSFPAHSGGFWGALVVAGLLLCRGVHSEKLGCGPWKYSEWAVVI